MKHWLWLCVVFSVLHSASAHLDVEATVNRVLDNLSVGEKARQLDIFRAADMLSNGQINMTKAEETSRLASALVDDVGDDTLSAQAHVIAARVARKQGKLSVSTSEIERARAL